MAADINNTEIWKLIPPEEKLKLLSQAQARGIMVVLSTIVISGTVAVGLKIPAFLWVGLIGSIFVFQFAAGKRYKDLRPKLCLEYLAARAAARRFAFTANGKDLELYLIFRGHLQIEIDPEQMDEPDIKTLLEVEDQEMDVWIALFGDVVVAMSEKAGGAKLEYSGLITNKLNVTPSGSDENNGYNNERMITITSEERKEAGKIYRFTSDLPAAFVVFEKKLVEFRENAENVSSLSKLDAAGTKR